MMGAGSFAQFAPSCQSEWSLPKEHIRENCSHGKNWKAWVSVQLIYDLIYLMQASPYANSRLHMHNFSCLDHGSSNLDRIREMLWVCQREAVRHTHPYGFIVTWEVWGLGSKILMCRTHFGCQNNMVYYNVPSSLTVSWVHGKAEQKQWQLLFQIYFSFSWRQDSVSNQSWSFYLFKQIWGAETSSWSLSSRNPQRGVGDKETTSDE